MAAKRRREIDFNKVTVFSVVSNSLQIAAMCALTAYVMLSNHTTTAEENIVLVAIAAVVIAGALFDITDAVRARRVDRESDMLAETLARVEELNLTLRKQRHDFMNHLQVVFGLIELDQKDEAREYIERVYGDIRSVSRSMKTALPAVNALIAAKTADCESRGIRFETDIRSDWAELGIPAWEMCRVLGNLLDNAMDALEGVPSPCIRLELSADADVCRFCVEDNGPGIPDEQRTQVFLAGFTTKRTGHGMGLSIVRDILTQSGGSILLECVPGKTVFAGSVPRREKEKN